ncbi:thioredoxin family protein [Gaetbulibacter aestuarii]|uniref:Thioredoxin family protein n=1 Tax=Gaetbulibacter aestuarii TaxID=1502358 RepID=A0ABW7MYC3_9FLAO
MKTLLKLSLIAGLLLCVTAFTNNLTLPSNGYSIGDKAADFSLENIDGNMLSLADFNSAKGFIVIFTCNTCPYAQLYQDRIEALNKKYASKGYPVIAIQPNDTDLKPGDNLQAMKQVAREKGFTFPYLLDKDQSVYPKFGATKTPHVFILEKTNQGNIVRYTGGIDDNYKSADLVKNKYVENAVDELLNGKSVSQTETKAIGCSIKSKS